jgi:hypothetical protein
MSNIFEGKPSRVWSHGKWIEVGYIDDQPPIKARAEKRRQRRKEAFAVVQLQWAADMAKATETPGALVWILLIYKAWKTKSTVFPLTSDLLRQYGVHRETNRRVLAKLEASGLIKVERRNRQAPTITLLLKPPVT